MFKKPSFFIIASIVVFILLTTATMEVESPSDGKDTYGYPLRFYTTTGGKCAVCTQTFEWWKFGVDYIFVLAAGLGLVYIYKRLF
jgi:hypothetical protein